jgi:hypothetical protein
MNSELRTRAETRLLEAAGSLALDDPRPRFRERLRQLRERHTAAFDRAVAHYEKTVLPLLADAPDPLAAWVDYGVFLAGLETNGIARRIDESGRATSFRPPAAARDLVLFIPGDNAAAVLVLLEPVAPSAAQAATLDLLVNRKLGLS